MGRDEKCSLCSGYKVYKKVFRAREAWHSPRTLHIMFHDQAVRFITWHHPPTHTHIERAALIRYRGWGCWEYLWIWTLGIFTNTYIFFIAINVWISTIIAITKPWLIIYYNFNFQYTNVLMFYHLTNQSNIWWPSWNKYY